MLLAETRRSRPTVGLVLGAGGIRGCAHAGVIQVLREAGIPIDVVVGASVGSIFGLGVAADLPTAYIAKVAHEASPSQMLRFYMGRLRLDRRNPIARMLWDAGNGRTFDDLPVPFAVRATEMALGRPTVLARGPVIPAVQASIALPGVARPVRVGDSYYMDGGLFDTAPVSTARDMGADLVIAVCLGVNYVTPDFLRRRPWTRARFERWGRQGRPIRGGIIDHARFCFRILASSYEDPDARSDADLAIWPELGDIKPNSMFGGPVCYRQGVQAAREMLPEIERLLSGSRQAAAGGPS